MSWAMALPKGKSLAGMQSLRKRVEETTAFEDLPNEGGVIVGEVYGERLKNILKEVDPAYDLEPDAEELVLRMADEFVHRVTKRAAEYAKHRRSATLDAVDVQLCLEKHWGLVVPGIPSATAARPAALSVPYTYTRVEVAKQDESAPPQQQAAPRKGAHGKTLKRKAPGA